MRVCERDNAFTFTLSSAEGRGSARCRHGVGNYGVNLPCFRPVVPRFSGASASLVSNLSIVCKNIFSFSALFS